MSSFLELTMYSTLKGHHDYVELSTLLMLLSTWAGMQNLTGNYLSSTLPFTLHNDNYVELYIIIGAIPCSIGWVTNLMVFSQPLMDSRHRRITL